MLLWFFFFLQYLFMWLFALDIRWWRLEITRLDFNDSTSWGGFEPESSEKAAVAGSGQGQRSSAPWRNLPLPLLLQSLTVASWLLEGRSRVREFGGGRPRGDGRIRVQALGHLVADEVDEALEGLLHVDVVLSAGLKELETFGGKSSKQQEDKVNCWPSFFATSLPCVAAFGTIHGLNSRVVKGSKGVSDTYVFPL